MAASGVRWVGSTSSPRWWPSSALPESPPCSLAAGDLSFGVELSPEDRSSAAAQEALRADSLIEAWNGIGWRAVAPGKLDLVQPPEQLAKLVGASKFPWLIDNLSDPSKLRWFKQAQLLEVGGIKVGVLGVVAPDAALRLPDVTLDEALTEASSRATRSLREQGARAVIALVSGDRRAARLVGGAGPDVVVMGGLDAELPLPPSVHGRAILVHAGRQGQRVLTLDLELDGQGEPQDASSWSLQERQKALKKQIDELSGRIREWEKAKDVARSDLDVQRQRLAELDREPGRAGGATLRGALVRCRRDRAGARDRGRPRHRSRARCLRHSRQRAQPDESGRPPADPAHRLAHRATWAPRPARAATSPPTPGGATTKHGRAYERSRRSTRSST